MILIVLIALLSSGALSAISSAAETAVLMLPLGRIHRLVEADRPGSVPLQQLSEHRHRLRAVSTLVGGLAFAVWSGCGAWAGSLSVGGLGGVTAWTHGDAGTALLVTAASVGAVAGLLLCHALCQAFPRTLAVVNPERIGLAAARPARMTTSVVYPVARLLGAPFKWLVSVAGNERRVSAWAVTPEWRGAEAEGEEPGREEAEEALLEAVSDFAEKIAREVMVPRTDMAALPDTATVAEAVELIERSGFSRVPVYHESVDDVRGVLYAKDLLGAVARDGADVRPASLAREPFFVPETKPVEELLFEMRNRTHIAIVADEYGGTAGLVTLEDLLEEIVGEISDEYDREVPLLEDLGEGRWRVDARLPVDDLNERFGTDIETDADSVGGLFSEVAGHIPTEGETLEVEGLRFTVTQLEGTRIRALVVEPAVPPEEGVADA